MNRGRSQPAGSYARRDTREATDDDDYSEVGDEQSPDAARKTIDQDGDDGRYAEVDLDGYEEYLARLRSEASERPAGGCHSRPIPSESPQFYMVHAHNPSGTSPPPTCHPPSAPRPSRPASACPRLRTDCGGELEARSTTASGRNGRPSSGTRRKRQTGEAVNPRVRTVYQDSGRASTVGIKRLPTSTAALATISSKSHVFQHAELHDEYFKLVDVVSELKSACQLEQERRVKAIARVRRLEEIVALKDRKIESLLQARASGGCLDLGVGGSASTVAQRDRQHNALVQKLRVKIAQQAQMLGAYEEALQALRSGSKTTNLMELEEERGQLYQELYRLQALLTRQRREISACDDQVGSFVDMEASYTDQLAKLQDASKKAQHEKHQLEQQVALHRSRADNLQQQLSLEQRKRTYDLQVGSNGHGHTPTASSPSRAATLSRAIEDMKVLLRKESAASIKREKLKSPRTGALSASNSERTAVGPTGPKSPVTSSEPVVPRTPKTPTRSNSSSSSQRAQSRPTSAAHSRSVAGRSPMSPPVKEQEPPRHGDSVSSSDKAVDASQKGDAAPLTDESADPGEFAAAAHPSGSPEQHPQAAASSSITAGAVESEAACDTSKGGQPHTPTVFDDSTTAVPGSEDSDLTVASLAGSTQDSVTDSASEEAKDPVKANEESVECEGEPDSSEIHRLKLAEVERMLREVDDDMGNDLESNSSEEFLGVALLHTSGQDLDSTAVDDHDQEAEDGNPVKARTDRHPTLSSSSSASLPSSKTSRSSSSASSSSEADEQVAAMADTSSEAVAVGVAPAHVAASGYEDGYQSDFTEASSP